MVVRVPAPSAAESFRHGGWVVKVVRLRSGHAAAAHRPPEWRLEPNPSLPRIDALTAEGARAGMRAVIDARAAARASCRRRTQGIDVPSADEFREGLQIAAPDKREWRMLQAHAAAPDRTLASAALAAAGGWRRHDPETSPYGRLGRRMAERLGLGLVLPRPGEAEAWIAILAEPAPVGGPAGRVVWRQHPELSEALRRLGRE